MSNKRIMYLRKEIDNIVRLCGNRSKPISVLNLLEGYQQELEYLTDGVSELIRQGATDDPPVNVVCINKEVFTFLNEHKNKWNRRILYVNADFSKFGEVVLFEDRDIPEWNINDLSGVVGLLEYRYMNDHVYYAKECINRLMAGDLFGSDWSGCDDELDKIQECLNVYFDKIRTTARLIGNVRNPSGQNKEESQKA